MRHAYLRVALFSLALLVLNQSYERLLAGPSDRVFISGTLVRIDFRDETDASLLLHIDEGELRLKIVDQTPVRDPDGRRASLLSLSPGQEVEVQGTLSQAGITVDEVHVIRGSQDETERSGFIRDLKRSGGITSFDLEGTRVLANRFGTRVGVQNRGSDLEGLSDGKYISVRGSMVDGQLLAGSIQMEALSPHEARFDLEGRVTSLGKSSLELDVAGLRQQIAVTPKTQWEGTAEIGSSVQVVGTLGADNELEANLVTAASAGARLKLHLSPGHLKLEPGKTRSLKLSVRPSQNQDLLIQLNSENPQVATLPDSITIPKKEKSVQVSVQAGFDLGETLITATPFLSIDGTTASAIVSVKDFSGNARPELNFRPDELKLRTGEEGMMELILTPPPDRDVTVRLETSDAEVAGVAETVTISAGSPSARVKVKAGRAGRAIIGASATVVDTAGASVDLTARASVEVKAGPAKRPELNFRPDELKLSFDERAELELVLTPIPDKAQDILVRSSNDSVVVVDTSSVTIEAGQATVSVQIHSLKEVGVVHLVATLSTPVGDIEASAKVKVRR